MITFEQFIDVIFIAGAIGVSVASLAVIFYFYCIRGGK